MMEIRVEAAPPEVARAEPRPRDRRLPAADDERHDRREPRAGGVADLALAEGARPRPRRADHRALAALARGRAARTTSGRSSPTCASPARSSRTPTSSMFVYRDEYYNPEDTESAGIAEVILAKHRNGATGLEKLAFQKRYAKFADLAAALMARPSGSRRARPRSRACASRASSGAPRRVRCSSPTRSRSASVRGSISAPTATWRRAAAAPGTRSCCAASSGRRRCRARREAAADRMIERQHVWLGPEATTFDEPCEACLAGAGACSSRRRRDVHGTLRATPTSASPPAAAATGS